MDSVVQEKYDRPLRRWSPPAIVIFLAVCTLTTGTLLGASASITLYNFPSATAGIGTCQSLILISSSITVIFVGTYLLAARRNEPVGDLRPPIRPLHGACFIVMRVVLVFWVISTIGSVAVSIRMKTCQVPELCVLQRISTASSGTALLSSIVILCGLERCEMAFETPTALRIRPTITCRISAFENILDRSVSRRKIDCEKQQPQRSLSDASTASTAASQVKRKPIPQTPEPVIVRSTSPAMTVWPPVAPNQNQNRDIWAEAWKSLVQETGSKGPQSAPASHGGLSSYPASSVYSTHTSSSDQSRSTGHTRGTTSSRGSHSHSSSSRKSGRASPSSSISSSARRSPLSTMRTVENPEVAICPDLRFFSLPSSPPRRGKYRSTARSSRSMPPTHALQQQALGMVAPLRLRPSTSPRSVINDPPNSRSRPVTPKGPRRAAPRAADSRCGSGSQGAYQRYRPVRDHAITIEAHTQKIMESARASMEQKRIVAGIEENARRLKVFDMGRSVTPLRPAPHPQGRVAMPAYPPNVRVRDIYNETRGNG